MNQTKFNKNAVSHTSNATKIDERKKENLIVTITRKKHQKNEEKSNQNHFRYDSERNFMKKNLIKKSLIMK